MRDLEGIPEIIKTNQSNIEVIKEFVGFYKYIEETNAKKSFVTAKAKLQSNLPEIIKSKFVKNRDGTIRYSYATYDDIVKKLKPLLETYGFSLQFKTSFEENSVIVHCILSHVDGYSEETSFKAEVQQSSDIQRMLPIQEWGSALTYAKRYSLSLILGLATEEDTDANTDEEVEIVNKNDKNDKNDKTMPEKKEDETKITQKQISKIYALLANTEYTKEEKKLLISKMINRNITSLSELTKEEASKIIEFLDGLSSKSGGE